MKDEILKYENLKMEKSEKAEIKKTTVQYRAVRKKTTLCHTPAHRPGTRPYTSMHTHAIDARTSQDQDRDDWKPREDKVKC